MMLNWGKCVLIPLAKSYDDVMLKTWIVRFASNAGELVIRKFAKLLGVYVGPEAYAKSWELPTAKLVERARLIRTFQLGLSRSAYLFNRDAVSVISHVAQFIAPSRQHVMKADRAVQKVTATPFYSLPKEFTYRMREMGFPVQFQSVAVHARSVMARAAANSSAFDDALTRIQSAWDHPDCLFAPGLSNGDWHKRCIVSPMSDNLHRCEQIPGASKIFAAKMKIQTKMYECILSNDIGTCTTSNVRPLLPSIRRRLTYWDIGEDVSTYAQRTIANMMKASKMLPPGVVTSVVYTVCNAWPTTRRFQPYLVGPCHACSLVRMDHVIHYLMCPTMKRAWAEIGAQFDFPDGRRNTILAFSLTSCLEDHEIVRRCIICDCFRKAFNGMRCGGSPSRLKQVFTARLRFWAMKDAAYAKFLRQWLGDDPFTEMVRPTRKKKAKSRSTLAVAAAPTAAAPAAPAAFGWSSGMLG